MIPRLSQKLSTKIKAGKLGRLPLDENPYADWSCHLFTAGRTQYIIWKPREAFKALLSRSGGSSQDGKDE